MSVSIKKPIASAALSLTPLIDVVFLLLVFFLVASQFAREDMELPVKLPSASSALPMTIDPEILVVNVDATGQFFMEGTFLTLAELQMRIDQAVRDNPVNQTVVIRGDKTVPYQAVVDVLNVCHQAKVPSYKLTTSQETDQP